MKTRSREPQEIQGSSSKFESNTFDYISKRTTNRNVRVRVRAHACVCQCVSMSMCMCLSECVCVCARARVVRGVVCIIIFNQSVKKLIIGTINMTEKERELSPESWPLNLRQAKQNTITRSNI